MVLTYRWIYRWSPAYRWSLTHQYIDGDMAVIAAGADRTKKYIDE